MYVAYKLAKKKNRTKAGWVIASFFFGWFAVLFLAVKEKHYPIGRQID
jgi:hypothetical protein